MSKLEPFGNKSPKKWRKKDFLGFIFLFCLILIPSSIYIFQISPSSQSTIPNMYIKCYDTINKDDYVNCSIYLENDIIESKIKIRGHFTATLAKKGYRIELCTRKSLLGMRSDDDWILFAMYMDFTDLRTKLSFDLWRSLQEMDNDQAILPESRYVNLFINSEFKGLYLLAEKNDKKLFGLDQAQDDIDSSLIFHCSRNHKNFEEYESDYWEQSWPNEQDGIFIMEDILPDLIEFVSETSDNEFFNETNGIYTKFERDNLIDFFLFNVFNYHRDFWSKNYFLIRDTAPNKFYLIPWDFDNSFGQRTWKKYDADDSYEKEIKRKNKLFDRLLDDDDFRQDCKDRWFELRKELWTKDFILDMLSEMYDEIKDSLEADMRKWLPEINFNEYIDHLFQWIPDRLEFCDEYFDEF